MTSFIGSLVVLHSNISVKAVASSNQSRSDGYLPPVDEAVGVQGSMEVRRVNPLLKLKSDGTRVGLLPRKGVLAVIRGTVGFRWNHRSVKHELSPKDNITVYNYETCPRENADCVVARPLPESVFPSTVTYCLHSQNDIVSVHLRSHGNWEFALLYFIWAVLVQDPDMQFIDIGANIGAMTLVVAKLNRHVVAVEPLRGNLNILCKAVIENDATESVTIVPHALSDQRTTFKPQTPAGNWGGTWMLKDPNGTLDDGNTVTSILTDDLLKLIPFRKAFLKMDIEGHEPAALRSAVTLFEQVYIPVVAMEWGRMQDSLIRGNVDALSVLDFFYDREYSAYRDGGTMLNRDDHRTWGENIYWIHEKYVFEVDPWTVF